MKKKKLTKSFARSKSGSTKKKMLQGLNQVQLLKSEQKRKVDIRVNICLFCFAGVHLLISCIFFSVACHRWKWSPNKSSLSLKRWVKKNCFYNLKRKKNGKRWRNFTLNCLSHYLRSVINFKTSLFFIQWVTLNL